MHVQNMYTVVTSLLLVFDYHARNTLTLYYLWWDYLLKDELSISGVDPGFQVRGRGRRAEGGTNIFEVFRVKNHDFTPKNLIFSNLVRPPPGSAPVYIKISVSIKLFMSWFIAQDCVCTASKLLCFKSSDYCNEAP